MARQRHLTKLTVQEALNKEHYTDYVSAYDNEIDLTTAALVSAQTFPATAAYGHSTLTYTIFDVEDGSGVKLIYSKVSVESDGALVIRLADKLGNLGVPIYTIAASLPITFVGYDITDMQILTAASDSSLGITAWR